jgi:hypothetical protein
MKTNKKSTNILKRKNKENKINEKFNKCTNSQNIQTDEVEIKENNIPQNDGINITLNIDFDELQDYQNETENYNNDENSKNCDNDLTHKSETDKLNENTLHNKEEYSSEQKKLDEELSEKFRFNPRYPLDDEHSFREWMDNTSPFIMEYMFNKITNDIGVEWAREPVNWKVMEKYIREIGYPLEFNEIKDENRLDNLSKRTTERMRREHVID